MTIIIIIIKHSKTLNNKETKTKKDQENTCYDHLYFFKKIFISVISNAK